jgi:hypothetical protein
MNRNSSLTRNAAEGVKPAPASTKCLTNGGNATAYESAWLLPEASANGNTVAEDPASLGGGATDHHVIYEGLSRVGADAVLVGARTVHGGDTIFSVWHPDMVNLRTRGGWRDIRPRSSPPGAVSISIEAFSSMRLTSL